MLETGETIADVESLPELKYIDQTWDCIWNFITGNIVFIALM